jgi:hypothetical protein
MLRHLSCSEASDAVAPPMRFVSLHGTWRDQVHSTAGYQPNGLETEARCGGVRRLRGVALTAALEPVLDEGALRASSLIVCVPLSVQMSAPVTVRWAEV